MMRRRSLQAALRTAILKSPLSRQELASQAGLAERTVSRFLRQRQGSITLDTADRLTKVLGYELAKTWG